MNRFFAMTLAALVLAAGTPAARALQWSEDLASAATQARQEGRWLLLNFSGSDWCGWCIRLDRDVFSQPAFKEFAAAHLVPVLLDFPLNKPQSPAVKAQNQRLQRYFNIEGFPTFLLFTPQGEFAALLGYEPGGPEVFIATIRRAQARHLLRAPTAPPAPRLPPL